MANDIKDIDDHSGIETTGHSWDGIKELNTPLPRWWLITWYVTIAWAIVYMILMPAIPALPGLGTNTPGIRGQSDRVNVAASIDQLHTARQEDAARLLGASLQQIETDGAALLYAGTGRGNSLAVDGHRVELSVESAHLNKFALALIAIQRNAGHALQRLPGVPIGKAREELRGGNVLYVRRAVLVVECARLRTRQRPHDLYSLHLIEHSAQHDVPFNARGGAQVDRVEHGNVAQV